MLKNIYRIIRLSLQGKPLDGIWLAVDRAENPTKVVERLMLRTAKPTRKVGTAIPAYLTFVDPFTNQRLIDNVNEATESFLNPATAGTVMAKLNTSN